MQVMKILWNCQGVVGGGWMYIYLRRTCRGVGKKVTLQQESGEER